MRSIVLLILFVACAAFMAATGTVSIRSQRSQPAEFDEPVATLAPAVAEQRPSRSSQTRRTSSSTSRVTGPEFTIEGRPRSSREEAWQAAYLGAARTIEDAFNLRQEVTVDDVKRLLTGDQKVETIAQGAGDTDAFKVILTVKLDDQYVSDLAKREREYRTNERMGWMARGLAVAVAALLAIAGYVRLDEWSKGYLSGALKLIAVLAVVGVGCGAFLMRW